MSDLDDLAAVAQRSPASLQRKPKDRTALIAWAVIGGILVVGVVVWAMKGRVGSPGLPNPFSSAPTKATDPKDLPFGIVHTKYKIGGGGSDWITGYGYSILNKSDAPLTINRVIFNGEFDANIALSHGDYSISVDKTKGYPITISIGEWQEFLEWEIDPKNDNPGKSYRKTVVYLTVETDRGTFRVDAINVH